MSGLSGPRRPRVGSQVAPLGAQVPAGATSFALPDEVFLCLQRRFPAAGRLLEFGSGAGTARLVHQGFEVTSIEHDEDFLFRYPSTYVYAPIEGTWYKIAAVRQALDRGPFDVIVVDGPPGPLRQGLLAHVDLLPAVPLLFDDTQRSPDRKVAATIAKRRRARLRTYRCAGGRAFSTVDF